MKAFSSRMAPKIIEYLKFRSSMGFSDAQEKTLAQFDAYCAKNHPEIETLSKEAVRGWVAHETANGHGGMYNKIGSLRLFAKYLGNGAYILPINSVPKKPKYTSHIISDSELSRLLGAADCMKISYDPFLNDVMPVLLRLLYTCGLRPGEGRLLKRANINFSTGEVLISKSKSHKERLIVMSEPMLELCRRYDISRSAVIGHSEFFFARSDGTSLSDTLLDKLFNLCWQQANPGIPPKMLPRVRPYDLRHRFASANLQRWLDEGRDLYAMLPYLCSYMGHAKFTMTAYYIHILPEKLLRSQGVDWERLDKIGAEVSIWKG